MCSVVKALTGPCRPTAAGSEETGASLAGYSGSGVGGRAGRWALGPAGDPAAVPYHLRPRTPRTTTASQRGVSPQEKQWRLVTLPGRKWEVPGEASPWWRPGRGTERPLCLGQSLRGVDLGWAGGGVCFCQPLPKRAPDPARDHHHHGKRSSNNQHLALIWWWID